jgi:hypothetical protein
VRALTAATHRHGSAITVELANHNRDGAGTGQLRRGACRRRRHLPGATQPIPQAERNEPRSLLHSRDEQASHVTCRRRPLRTTLSRPRRRRTRACSREKRACSHARCRATLWDVTPSGSAAAPNAVAAALGLSSRRASTRHILAVHLKSQPFPADKSWKGRHTGGLCRFAAPCALFHCSARRPCSGR